MRLGGADPAVPNADGNLHGHSTKQGSAWVRWVLEEAAPKAKTGPPVTGFYAQWAARRGRPIATTAVAGKLLARAFQVLKEVEATSQPSEKVTEPGALGLHAGPATRPKF